MFEKLLKQWANEQGFQTWSQDHAAVLRNLAKWLNSNAVEHSVHLTGGGLCAECGLTEENHPSAKPYCLAFIPASR